MNKLHTATQLQTLLDDEMGWRIQEISRIKEAARKAEKLAQASLIRAGIALLYAHWEGFVKNAVTGYLNYVDTQGLTYAELQNCFVALGLKRHLNQLNASRNAGINLAAVTFIREQLNVVAKLKFDSAINTESNLSSALFHNIMISVGLDPTEYETKYHLIDESLLKRRNSVAHGNYLELTFSDWTVLSDEVLALLRRLKNDIENATTLVTFKRKSQK